MVDNAVVVVSNDEGDVAYIPFAAPHAVIALDNPSDGALGCRAVSATYAACQVVFRDEGEDIPEDAALLPLDGGSATQADLDDCDVSGTSLSGSNLLWTCFVSEDDTALYSQPAGGSTATKISDATSSGLISAYGDAVASDHAQNSLLQVSPTNDVTTLVAAQQSPVTVDAFGLAHSRIVYTDDQPVSGQPDQVESAFLRHLVTKGKTTHASAATRISGDSARVTGNLVGASDAIAVYATRAGIRDQFDVATLRIVRGTKTTSISNVIAQGVIQVSGDEVLFQRPSPAGSNIEVYDASTNKTRIVRQIHGGIDYTSTALYKHFIAYAGKHGAIYRKNFVTGKRVKLAAKLAHDPGGVEFSVYEYGDWVGWTALPVDNELAKPLNRIRNAKTMKPATKLSHRLYSLTSSGALLDSTATFRAGFSQQGTVPNATTFWLRSYSGHTKKLLTKKRYLAGPEISGGRVAWAAGDGVLRIARLPGS